MRKLLQLIALLGLWQVGNAQQTENRDVAHFTGIGVSQGIEVHIKKGTSETVQVETTGIAPSEVITEVSGNYLKIRMANGNHRGGSAKVYVTYVSLNDLYASSAGSLYGDGILESDNLKMSASSAGNIELKIKVNKLNVDASSAANVELDGEAESADIETSSAGEVDAYDLTATSATIEAVSAGSVKISVKDSIDASASSGGDVHYRGNPSHAFTHSSSGGTVRKTG